MKIIVKNDGEKVLIESMCDIALKAGGIANLKGINNILASIKMEGKENATEQVQGDGESPAQES